MRLFSSPDQPLQCSPHVTPPLYRWRTLLPVSYYWPEMRIRDVGSITPAVLARSLPGIHGRTDGRTDLQLLPCLDLRRPIPSRQTERSKQVEERKPREQNKLLTETSARTEVSVYTVVGQDHTRRLHSEFSQLILSHVDRLNDCLRYLPASASKKSSLANKWNYYSQRSSCETRF